MTKLIKAMVTAILLLLSVPTFSQIVTGKPMFQRKSGVWRSFLLVMPDSLNTRASTPSANTDPITLMFDFRPPNCAPEMKFVFSLGHVASHDVDRDDVAVTLRTDSGARVDVVAIGYTSMGDTDAMIIIPKSDTLMSEITDMSRGQILRTKIVYGSDEASAYYSVYFMDGMTAAYRRAHAMCTDPASIRR